jgi:hypothetical protein
VSKAFASQADLVDWPHTGQVIAALKPAKLVPGRGAVLTTPERVQQGLDDPRIWTTQRDKEMWQSLEG